MNSTLAAIISCILLVLLILNLSEMEFKFGFNPLSIPIILSTIALIVNVNIRMYNFDDVQCTVIPSVAYGFVTGMNLQLC